MNVVNEMCDQLKAMGFPIQYFRLVRCSDSTLKISKRDHGVMVTYNTGTDTYEVQGYKGITLKEKITDVYCDELASRVADEMQTELIRL